MQLFESESQGTYHDLGQMLGAGATEHPDEMASLLERLVCHPLVGQRYRAFEVWATLVKVLAASDWGRKEAQVFEHIRASPEPFPAEEFARKLVRCFHENPWNPRGSLAELGQLEATMVRADENYQPHIWKLSLKYTPRPK